MVLSESLLPLTVVPPLGTSIASCCLVLPGVVWAKPGGQDPQPSFPPMPLIRNRRRRIRFSLLSGDPYTPSFDAPCSGGDGGMLRDHSAALPPPPRFGGLRRDREPTNEGFAGPGGRPKDPCPPFAGLRIGVSVFPAAWRTQTLDRLLGPGYRHDRTARRPVSVAGCLGYWETTASGVGLARRRRSRRRRVLAARRHSCNNVG